MGADGKRSGSEAKADIFARAAHAVAEAAGSPWAFSLAVFSVVLWAVLGPQFGYSDTWQLVINTATTILTFLMVFLIQNTQNRDTRVIQLKLDELIRAMRGARAEFINLEKCTEAELVELANDLENQRSRMSDRLEKVRQLQEQRSDMVKTQA